MQLPPCCGGKHKSISSHTNSKPPAPAPISTLRCGERGDLGGGGGHFPTEPQEQEAKGSAISSCLHPNTGRGCSANVALEARACDKEPEVSIGRKFPGGPKWKVGGEGEEGCGLTDSPLPPTPLYIAGKEPETASKGGGGPERTKR